MGFINQTAEITSIGSRLLGDLQVCQIRYGAAVANVKKLAIPFAMRNESANFHKELFISSTMT